YRVPTVASAGAKPLSKTIPRNPTPVSATMMGAPSRMEASKTRMPLKPIARSDMCMLRRIIDDLVVIVGNDDRADCFQKELDTDQKCAETDGQFRWPDCKFQPGAPGLLVHVVGA